MRALDTNVLARFFIDDPDDPQAAKQRPAAIGALSERAFVPVTVLLELEWVMRGFYEMGRRDIARVLSALAGIEHITIDDRNVIAADPAATTGGVVVHVGGASFQGMTSWVSVSKRASYCRAMVPDVVSTIWVRWGRTLFYRQSAGECVRARSATASRRVTSPLALSCGGSHELEAVHHR